MFERDYPTLQDKTSITRPKPKVYLREKGMEGPDQHTVQTLVVAEDDMNLLTLMALLLTGGGRSEWGTLLAMEAALACAGDVSSWRRSRRRSGRAKRRWQTLLAM